MKQRLGGLLSKSSEMLFYAKVMPEARFAKIMNEIKAKIKDNRYVSPEEFSDTLEKFFQFKTNYVKLAYPKAELNPMESKLGSNTRGSNYEQR